MVKFIIVKSSVDDIGEEVFRFEDEIEEVGFFLKIVEFKIISDGVFFKIV